GENSFLRGMDTDPVVSSYPAPWNWGKLGLTSDSHIEKSAIPLLTFLIQHERQQLRRNDAVALSCTAHERDALFSVNHKGNGRTHAAAQACLVLEQLFTFISGVGEQTAVIDDLEDEVACSGQRSASDASSTRSAPPFLLRDGVPREKHASASLHRSDGRRNARSC